MKKEIGLTGDKGLVGQVAGLDGLIEYQDDAVVSKTLLKKQVGTVTLFAFDKGQGLSEHTAPFDAMVFVIDGETDVSIAGKKNRVRNGEMLIMPANVPHSLDAVERFKMVLVMIRSE